MNVFPLDKIPENDSSKFIENQVNEALVEVGGNKVVGYIRIRCLRNAKMELKVKKGLLKR